MGYPGMGGVNQRNVTGIQNKGVQSAKGKAAKSGIHTASTALATFGGPWGMAAAGGLELIGALMDKGPKNEQQSFQTDDFYKDPRGYLTDPRQSAYNTAKTTNLMATAAAKQAQQRKPIEFQGLEMPGMPPPVTSTGGFAPLDLSALIAELEGQLPENNPDLAEYGKRTRGWMGMPITAEHKEKVRQKRARTLGRY